MMVHAVTELTIISLELLCLKDTKMSSKKFYPWKHALNLAWKAAPEGQNDNITFEQKARHMQRS